jgi:hypothetical protein
MLILFISKKLQIGGVTCNVEYLPSNHKALSSIARAAKMKKKKEPQKNNLSACKQNVVVFTL